MEHELHQLFDPESSTFTYVLVDSPRAKRSSSIRSIIGRSGILGWCGVSGLTVRYVVETHTHADHVTGCGAIARRKRAPGPRRLSSAAFRRRMSNSRMATSCTFGAGEELLAIHTPGHTSGSSSYFGAITC